MINQSRLLLNKNKELIQLEFSINQIRLLIIADYMKILLEILLALCISQTIAQRAFILSSSVGFYNYRQNANALQIYHTLKHRGFEDQQITLAFPENVGCCQKNPMQGSVSFRDNDNTNINRHLSVDMRYNSMNARSVLNQLGLKYSRHTLNLHRLKLDNSPYLIYLTGHGGDFYFKIRERQALVSQNFQQMLEDLNARQSRSQIFLISDSCSASTPFEGIHTPNFIGIGSSSEGEKSLSYGYDSLLNSPKSDEFTFYLTQFLTERQTKRTASIKELWQYMDVGKLKVHSKLVGSLRQNSNRKLGQFFSHNVKVQEKKIMINLPSDLDFQKQAR